MSTGMPRLLLTTLFVTTWFAPDAHARRLAPLLVTRLSVTSDPRLPATAIVHALAENQSGDVVADRELRRIVGTCVEDVGGMESLSVVRCELATGAVLDFELMQAPGRLFVNEFETATPTSERRRVRQHRVTRVPRGTAVAPRCAQTLQTPMACMPTREPVPATSALTACHVGLTRTTYDAERRPRTPSVERFDIERVVDNWGDAYRDSDWSDVAPRPLTLVAARSLPGAQTTRARRVTRVMVEAEGGGSLTYVFDGAGRTSQVTWDPQADSRTFSYSYTYACQQVVLIESP